MDQMEPRREENAKQPKANGREKPKVHLGNIRKESKRDIQRA